MMNFGIRRARSEDWRVIHRIHERAVPYELHFLDEAARPRMESLERVFRGDLWVAEAASEILGFAACVGADISWLYVDPSHFRRGIGRALLRHAVEHCGETAHATVLANNVASLALMASEGFETAARETVSIVGYGVARVHKVRRVSVNAICAPSLCVRPGWPMP